MGKLLNNDTICAVATAPGVGGIAVVRLCGSDALGIAAKIWKGKDLAEQPTHTAHLGIIADSDGTPLDQAVATVFRAPGSYTGDDTVEFSIHGSTYVQKRLLERLVECGARLAEPGEYTRRAFACGHIDLSQAEAIADLISARSRAAHRVALSQLRGGVSKRLETLRQQLIDLGSLLELELDFSEEDVEFADRSKLIALAQEIHSEVVRLHHTYRQGTAIKDGVPVAIAGPTNAGKSSLLNALLGDDRAIVSDIHGTTRDTIEDTIPVGDYTVRLIDTAGLRHTDDTIEQIGISRTRRAIKTAAIILAVADATDPGRLDTDMLCQARENGQHIIVLVNKSDLTDPTAAIAQLRETLPAGTDIIAASVHTGDGLSRLHEALKSHLRDIAGDADADILITNARHAEALAAAADTTTAIIAGLTSGLSGDLVALDIRDTIAHLSAITGAITSDTLLHTIFSRFCIGK